MDPIAAPLAAQRLAPVQCNSLGHPETSGFPTLDYYLSSNLMEPVDGDEHYTEQLIRLPNLSIYYEAPNVRPAALKREDLGFRSDGVIYWCGQSLFKYLPQYDDVFPRIARAVGACQFIFIQHHSPIVSDVFRRRLEKCFAAFGLKSDDYCLLLPRLEPAQFVAAIGPCDIVLDSIGWSGNNSTLESLTHSIPIVTMPGKLMRGRHTAAILTMMDVFEPIAETVDDYICKAARLALDSSWRMQLKDKIANGKHRIYCDRSCIEGLEDFLIRVACRTSR
jgi:predicted O-linked N-acetylglucosamine transferase (SPINDLY family)